MAAYVWIDRKTGTWGEVEDLVVVELGAAGREMDNDEGDEYTAIATLEDASDDEITCVADHAIQYGYGLKLPDYFSE